jgi:flavin reductase (DIM6/NTAB) family NADH-FMN oxidoreductase RutF
MAGRSSYRRALGQFATGVTVVSGVGELGEDIGLTINSFTSVSLDPPLVLWSLRRGSYYHAAFVRCEYFAVSVLSEHQEKVCRRFAGTSANRFSGIELSRGIGGVPIIGGAVAVFECRRETVYSGGDHTIFMGRVQRFAYHSEASPLIFCKGTYAPLANPGGEAGPPVRSLLKV